MERSVKEFVLIKQHDLRNYVGAAMTHIQMLLIDHAELEKNDNIKAAIDALVQCTMLSKAVSRSVKMDENDKVANKASSTISCHHQLFEIAKPAYERMRRIYPITITDSYLMGEEDRYIKGDRDIIASIRENIIDNAVKAGASELKISHEMKEYCLVISYEDNGKGMTQDEIENIYMKSSHDGIIHGIGTKVILKAVQESDGAYVNIVSTPGEGTTIRFLVPYVEKGQ